MLFVIAFSFCFESNDFYCYSNVMKCMIVSIRLILLFISSIALFQLCLVMRNRF